MFSFADLAMCYLNGTSLVVSARPLPGENTVKTWMMVLCARTFYLPLPLMAMLLSFVVSLGHAFSVFPPLSRLSRREKFWTIQHMAQYSSFYASCG